MKASTTLLSGLIILAAGVILILSNHFITKSGIVTTAGILFLLSGIVNTVLYLSGTDKDGNPKHRGASKFFGIVVSLASLLLGLSMFVFNDDFQGMIPILFALVLFFGALVQFFIVVSIRRGVGMPAWPYAFPAVMLILSIVVFFANLKEPDLMLISGCGLVVFGVGGFVESFLLKAANRSMNVGANLASNQDDDDKVVDLSHNEVKEIKGLDD